MLLLTKNRLVTWTINSVAVFIAAAIVPGIHYGSNISGYITLVLAALVLGILNTILKPFLVIITLPLMLVTFGLFAVLINAFLLYIVGFFVPGFSVDGMLSAIFGGIIIRLVSITGNYFLGPIPAQEHSDSKDLPQTGQRRRRRDNDDDDNDDYIDV